ncbi:MAG: hypothetical protein N3H84_03145 [Candidatus Caldarchaeum sp.]|nr:hypothetical protein [Candidatus Caldarchaeum sp.]
MRWLFLAGTVVLLAVGLLGYVESQQVITTTTTRVVTIPPTTYTTQTVIAGTTIVATVQMPGMTIVYEVRQPDQTCTVVFTAQAPPRVVAIPGTTFVMTGTTFSTVFTQSRYTTIFTYVEGGTTLVTTGLRDFPVTTFGMVMTMPVYGAIREFCNRITITQLVEWAFASVPATYVTAEPGTTISFQGTTYTAEAVPRIDLTTSYTEVRPGTTNRETVTFPPTAYTTRQTVTPTTVRQTVVSPGTTITQTITTVITVQQQTTPTTPRPTTPTTPTTPAQTTPTTPRPTTPTTTPTPTGFGLTELVIPVAVIVVLLAVVLIALRLRR